jgi:hypothetical protein
MAPNEGTSIPLSWVGTEEVPIVFANQFVIQFQPDEFVLSVGQVTPPPLVGTPEQVAEQASQITFIPVRTVARIGFNRSRLRELIAALQANLENHDKTMRSFDPLARGDEQ